ncbi:MAG: Release factor glutamine methyltransferase [Chlamydiia bacterium]|nr:Release factor glutamine methyltransferase [Chlamydiia bacterium]
MTSKKRWNTLSKKFLAEHKKYTDIQEFKINEFTFKSLPGVFSPVISSDTRWYIDRLLPILKGKEFLEIGAGTGSLACMAKLCGATKVAATDINKTAIDNINQNIELHSLDIEVFEGDIFDPIPKERKFDIIFWNHPFNYTADKEDISDELSLSVFDFEYKALKKYISGAKKWLREGGLLLLGTGNIAKINNIKSIAQACGYTLNLMNKTEVDISSCDSNKMDLRIYSFEDI